MPAPQKIKHVDVDVSDGVTMPEDFDDIDDYEDYIDSWHRSCQAYLERCDANAKRLKKEKIVERVSQGAIRDMIKSNGYTANLEVMPAKQTLRRMDIYGEYAPGDFYVVEVKMGYKDWISGVAQLDYYSHLLLKSGNPASFFILAFHCEETDKVPFDIVSYCDEHYILACKAEEVADIINDHAKTHGGPKTNPTT